MDSNLLVSTRFPYDVLREIILHAYVYTLETEYGEPKVRLQLPSPPIVASHVCRSWRYRLLSDSSMWTCLLIPPMKPDGILELLRRSKSAPLNVFLKLGYYRPSSLEHDHDDISHMLSSLFQQIYRFKTLYLHVSYGPPSAQVQQVLSYLQQPAPELQTFFFSYKCLDFPLGAFIDALFSGETPNLKRMICHHLSVGFRELQNPLFHNLSELYLVLPDTRDRDFGLLLNLLALSPCLRLLHIYAHCNIDVRASFGDFGGHGISLPYMQRLVLEVKTAAELVTLLLKHITLPSHLKWHIMSQHIADFDDSPALIQRISKACFVSQNIRLTFRGSAKLSLKEEPGPDHINEINHNRLAYTFENIPDLMDSWVPLMQSIKSSRITHLNLEFVNGLQLENNIAVPTILTSMKNLETLHITSDITYNGYKDPCQFCISALVPTQNDELEQATTDINHTHTSTAPPFPCPFLREIIMNTKCSLNETLAVMLRECLDKRRREGYHLRIFIETPRMNGGVESILQLPENKDIQVEVVPIPDWL